MPARESVTARFNPAFGALLLFLALGLGWLALLEWPSETAATWWKGYRCLLVEATVPEADVLHRILAAGIREPISESTQPIEISNWAGLETLPVPVARLRLLPGDPRLDTYLGRIGLWFAARAGGIDYRVFYLGTDLPAPSWPSLERAIARELAGLEGRYLFPETEPAGIPLGGAALPLACAAAVIAAACAVGPLSGRSAPALRGILGRARMIRRLDRVTLRIFLVLPWAMLAGGGIYAAALSALWGIALAEAADRLDMPLEEFRAKGGMRAAAASLALQGWPSAALFLTASLASLTDPAALPSLGLASLGTLVAIPGYALLTARPTLRHRFTPLPIASRGYTFRAGATTAGATRAVLACGAVVVLGLCKILLPSVGQASPANIELPRPAYVHGSLRPLPSEARRRAVSEIGEILPGLPSYLEHRAVQEALPYLRLWENRSDPFASARLPTPSSAAQSAQGIDFTDDWARSAFTTVPRASIEGMLLRQGRAMIGRVDASGGRSDRPLAPIGSLLYIFLLVPPIGRILLGVPYGRAAASGELRQEA